jgi:hypothetical protein
MNNPPMDLSASFDSPQCPKCGRTDCLQRETLDHLDDLQVAVLVFECKCGCVFELLLPTD